MRAQAVKESNWIQAAEGDWEWGDCPPGYSGHCPHSFGLLQVRWNADPTSRTTFPMSRDYTAFSLDHALYRIRAYFEGYETWLMDVEHGAEYRPGDIWGCLGAWYAGRWYTEGARAYIADVRRILADRTWERPGF